MLIVGLGNPGKEYETTFHNMGFLAIDALAERLNKKIKKAECSALTSTFSVGGETVVLAKPLTYMNLSGQAVKSLLKKYGMTPDELIVLYDDLDIDRFSVRARKFGSGGTHNGMKNIIFELKTEQFKRIRLGIGKTDVPVKDYVLSRIPSADISRFNETFQSVAAALETYLRSQKTEPDFNALMVTLNT